MTGRDPWNVDVGIWVCILLALKVWMTALRAWIQLHQGTNNRKQNASSPQASACGAHQNAASIALSTYLITPVDVNWNPTYL